MGYIKPMLKPVFKANTPAYSYVRFSTREQLKGDSLRRQVDLSANFAKKHGLLLDEKLTFRDLGISAFDKSNVTTGKLGEFLTAIETGHVAAGSVLLVESLDRLSRAKIFDAQRVFLDILSKGITIVTLSDEQVYSGNSGDSSNDFVQLIVSLGIMSRAHEESATKSRRLKEAWANKRLKIDTKKLSGQCPAWMSLDKNKNAFDLIPEKVAVIRRIVELVRSGQGKGVIAKRLNEAGIQSIGTKGTDHTWYESYISKIIKNRALIGEFQPHRVEEGKRVPDGDPIVNYFPRVISDEEFAVLQNLIDERGRKSGGRRGKLFPNLFTGLLKCGYCGSTMVYVDKGIDKRGNRDPAKNRFLVCHKAKRGLNCFHVPWNYSELESAFFLYARKVDFEQFVSTANNRISELRAINEQLLLAKASLDTLDKQIIRLVNSIAESDQPSKYIVSKIDQSTVERDRLAADVQQMETQRDSLLARKQLSGGALEALRDVAKTLGEKSGDELFLYRSMLNEYMRRVLDQIFLYPGGAIQTSEQCTAIKREMLNAGKWTEDEIAVYVDSMLHSEPRKHDRFFSILSGDSVAVVVQPESVAKEALRRIMKYPNLLADMLPTSAVGMSITAGRV
jgi:DNA invertase Pin-like site-specific DNA recombinase